MNILETLSRRFKQLLAVILPIACIFLIAEMIMHSNICLNAAKNALTLCFYSIIPALLPFFVLSFIIINTGFASLVGYYTRGFMRPLFNVSGEAILPVILGMAAGYPSGAKITCELYDEGLITKNEAERLLGYTNNSGPLFIIGAVCAGMLKNANIGLAMLAVHLVSSVITGIITGIISRFGKNRTSSKEEAPKKDLHTILQSIVVKVQKNPWSIVTSAFSSATSTVIAICGFVVFFSVASTILLKIIAPFIMSFPDPALFGGIFTGAVEITNGISILAKIYTDNMLPIISAIIGFGGISVFMQVGAICSPHKLKLNWYFWGKCLQSILAFILTFIFIL